MPLLSFDIVKRYRGFSLDCRASFDSGITAVFGRSGSGKTTLLNCLAGLGKPDAGHIEFDGETLYSSSPKSNAPPERRRFGYVFQDAALFPHLDVLGNIQYGYKLTPRDRRRLEPDRLIELLQLSALLDRSIIDLSGGEKQRVALARALAASPRMLLLDEPLASLDAAFKGVIIRYLKSIRAELGIPMVYVSHSMSEVLALTDSVLVLSDGTAAAHGPTGSVLVHPDVSALADYASLENLLEATVTRVDEEHGLATLRLGNVDLFAPDVSAAPGSTVTVSIRAGEIILALDVPTRISARNVVAGTVEEVHTRGSRVLVYVDVGVRVVVEITPLAKESLGIAPRQRVYMIIKSTSVGILEPRQLTAPHPA